MEKTDDEMNKIISEIIKFAEEAELNAGYAGNWGDNGAGRLREQVKFYLYGRKGILPSEWRTFEIAVKRNNDSEYSKYIELKKKFE